MARIGSDLAASYLSHTFRIACWLVLVCTDYSLAAQVAGSKPLLPVWFKDVGSRSALIQDLLRDFSDQNQVQIRAETFIDLPSALLKARERSILPLAVLGPGDLVGLWRELDFSVVPMSYLEASDIKVMADFMIQGQQPRGVPILAGNHHVAFYNKQYLKTPPKRWLDLQKLLPELRSRGVAPAGWDYQQPFFFLAFMDSQGLFKQGTVQIDTPANRKACQSYKQLAEEGLIAPDCNYSCLGESFYQGKLAMILTTDWNFQDAKLALKDNFGVAPLPESEHGPMHSIILGTSLFFPGYSLAGKHRDILLKLATYLQSESVQRALGLSYQIPIRRSVLNSLPFHGDPNWQLVLDQMERSKALVAPSQMTHLWHILHKGLRVYLSGSMDIDSVFRRMQEQALARRPEKELPSP